MAKVNWIKTNHKGLRYREHPTRKHGIKKDRFYQFRHMTSGRRVEDSFGWLSEGWIEEKCLIEIAKIKQAKTTGEGPITLKEKRQVADETRKEKDLEQISVDEIWDKYKKIYSYKRSFLTEEGYFNKWIKPIIGIKPMRDVAAIHLERIRRTMTESGLSPRTVQYIMSIIRQIFNFAKRQDCFGGDNPVGKITMPKFDNKRMRFLTHKECDKLLKELKTRSINTHDIALLSLQTGMRAGEIFALTWSDVDLKRGILALRNTKNTKTRYAYLTEKAKDMLKGRKRGAPNDLVFPGRNGKKIVQISDAFNRAVDELKFNEGIDDERLKVTFHTLRHTAASHLVEAGVDLYAVKEILGHSDFKMTSRYAHLGQNTLWAAIKRLEQHQTGCADVIPLPEKKSN
jgi:integrase